MAQKNIKLRVKNLVGRTGTASPIQIADMLKIPIVFAELPNGIRGYLTRPVRRKTIVINDSLDEREVPIVIAHELGHALMHGTTGTFHTDTVNYCNARSEYEANLFALYLLSYSYDIDERLLQVAPRNRDVMTYKEAHLLLCHCIEDE
jgi:Zn-dependent peptidase ImmA (M78 family)|nr:MAG TPA: IrrE protein [Caudoviricetes sp.]